MATRPAKTGGNTTYTAEVAAGQTTIKASEVDGDLNEIYSNITNTNIAAGAALAYAKLNLTGQLLNADISSSAAITGAKLAINASVNAFQSVGATANKSISSIEDTFATLASLTSRGGRVVVAVSIATFDFTTSGLDDTTTIKLYRDASVIASWNLRTNQGSGASMRIPLMLSMLYVDAPGAGSYVYKLNAVTGNAGHFLLTPAANPGFLYALELT